MERIPGPATIKRHCAITTPVYLAFRRAGLEDTAENFLHATLASTVTDLPIAEYRRTVTDLARQYCDGDLDLWCDIAAVLPN